MHIWCLVKNGCLGRSSSENIIFSPSGVLHTLTLISQNIWQCADASNIRPSYQIKQVDTKSNCKEETWKSAVTFHLGSLQQMWYPLIW